MPFKSPNSIIFEILLITLKNISNKIYFIISLIFHNYLYHEFQFLLYILCICINITNINKYNTIINNNYKYNKYIHVYVKVSLIENFIAIINNLIYEKNIKSKET